MVSEFQKYFTAEIAENAEEIVRFGGDSPGRTQSYFLLKKLHIEI